MAKKSELPMGVTKLLLALTSSEKSKEQKSKNNTAKNVSLNLNEHLDSTPNFATI